MGDRATQIGREESTSLKRTYCTHSATHIHPHSTFSAMASLAGAFVNPFRNSFRYMQRQAHEQPVIFFSIILGAMGPLSVLIVPPIRKNYFGYVSPARPPTTYPLPRRERDKSLKGYD